MFEWLFGPKIQSLDDLRDLTLEELQSAPKVVLFPYQLRAAIEGIPQEYRVQAKQARDDLTDRVCREYGMEGVASTEGGWSKEGLGYLSFIQVMDSSFAVGMKLVDIEPDSEQGQEYLLAATDFCNRLIKLYQEKPWMKG